MAGVGKLLKQAQKMQKQIESLQAKLDAHEIDVTSGGGAVQIKITASGRFLSIKVDPELLKEDAELVNESLLTAVQDASKQAKDYNEAEMGQVSSGLQMPGFM